MSPQDVNPAAGSAGRSTRPLPTDALIVVPVRNTVLFPEIVFPITLGRAVDHRGRPAGGARAAPDRHRPAARSREGRSHAGRPLSYRHGRQHRALRHQPRRRPSPDLPGRPALPHHRLRRRLPLPAGPRPAPRRADIDGARGRGALQRAAGAGARGPRPVAARAAGAAPDGGGDQRRPACWPTSPSPTSTPRRRRSRTSSRPPTSCRGSTRCPSCSPIAWKCCACRPRSAARPRPRSTRASARCCCASRWPPSSASWVTKAPTSRTWPTSRRPSPRPGCRPTSRRRRRRSCAGCSARPRRRPSTA